MSDTKQIIQVFSDVSGGCPLCDQGVSSFVGDSDWLEEQTNHLLGHGCELLHVGQETTHDGEGNPWQRTTAVLALPD